MKAIPVAESFVKLGVEFLSWLHAFTSKDVGFLFFG
jgi:hypothetical protein